MATGIQTITRGPLFRPGIGLKVNSAYGDAVQELVDMGEERVNQRLRPRPRGVYLGITQAKPGQFSTGHYRRNVQSEVQGLRGRLDDNGVIYGPWLEGISPRNLTTRFRGYHVFRKTADWLNGQARGVALKHTRNLVRRLKFGL